MNQKASTYFISSAVNGYTAETNYGTSLYVASSWDELLELLKEIGPPRKLEGKEHDTQSD